MLSAFFAFWQILGPFEEQEEFTVEDFHLLEKITLSGCAEKVKIKVKQMGLKQKQYVCLWYYMRTNIFLLSLTVLISYFNFLCSPSNEKCLEQTCFILWPFMILNAKVVNSFMELSEQFACELRLTSVRPGIYN